MNAQLLLLVALVGPFCAFTHASPTELPTPLGTMNTEGVTDVTAAHTKAPEKYITVITSPSATITAVVPAEVTTEAVSEAAPPSVIVNTEDPLPETKAPTSGSSKATEPLITDPPAVETTTSTQPAEPKIPPKGKATAKPEKGEDVVIENGEEGGLSSGQVVGIVIGALLAVGIAIAVVIAVVRRMGKYSP